MKYNEYEEDLYLYEGISESTLNLLGLQEISYKLAKHAFDKRYGRSFGELDSLSNIVGSGDSGLSKVDDIRTFLSCSKEAAKKGKKKDALKHAGLALATAINPNQANTVGDTIKHFNKDTIKNMGSQLTNFKNHKKLWKLHKAIERKEKRIPGWKNSTIGGDGSHPKGIIGKSDKELKRLHKYNHWEKDLIKKGKLTDLSGPNPKDIKIGSHSKQFKEKMKQEKAINPGFFKGPDDRAVENRKKVLKDD